MDFQMLPPVLYKYKALDKNGFTLNIFKDNEIYFPSVLEFNDPFEGSIPLVYLRRELTVNNVFKKLREYNIYPNKSDDELKSFISSDEGRARFLSQEPIISHMKETQKRIENTFGIFCMTSMNNNFLMWSHYADSHKGICIGFDTKVLCDMKIGNIWKIKYQKKLPRFKMDEDIHSFVSKFLCTKSLVWRYEDEYRLIKSVTPNKILKIPSKSIVSVTFGNSMICDKEAFADTLISYNPLLKIFNSKISNNSFCVELDRMR